MHGFFTSSEAEQGWVGIEDQIALLLNPADTPVVAVKMREPALLCNTFAVLLATFRGALVAGVELENQFVHFWF